MFNGNKLKPLCRHWRDRVPIADKIVLASSLRGVASLDNNPQKSNPPSALAIPYLSVYLDAEWASAGSVWANCKGREIVKELELWRSSNGPAAIIVPWPDYGVIPPNSFMDLVIMVGSLIDEGEVVEVGCVGGHGRTGTLLAAVLGVLENVDAGEAVAALRSRYCAKAVETEGQAGLLEKILGGEVYIPPKEEVKWDRYYDKNFWLG